MIDAALVRIIGEENTILVWFVRLLAIVLVCIGALSAAVLLIAAGREQRPATDHSSQSVFPPEANPTAGELHELLVPAAQQSATEDRKSPAERWQEIDKKCRDGRTLTGEDWYDIARHAGHNNVETGAWSKQQYKEYMHEKY